MHVMILLSCGYLPQYKIPEVKKSQNNDKKLCCNIKDKKDREK